MLKYLLNIIKNKVQETNYKMHKYRKTVEYLADNNIDSIINNGTYDHAEIIFEQILKKATHCISLISQECNLEFYSREQVSEAFVNFVNKTSGLGKIRILVEKCYEKEIKNNVFINLLLKRYKEFNRVDSLKVYILKDNDKIKIDDKVFHILIADEKGPYRFELCKVGTGDTCDHREYLSAIANFGNEKQSSDLWDVIEKQITTNSSPVSFN